MTIKLRSELYKGVSHAKLRRDTRTEGESPKEEINEFGVFKEQKGQWVWELGSWRKLEVIQQM